MTSFCEKGGGGLGGKAAQSAPQYLIDDSSLREGTTKQSIFLSSTHYAQKIWVSPGKDRIKTDIFKKYNLPELKRSQNKMEELKVYTAEMATSHLDETSIINRMEVTVAT